MQPGYTGVLARVSSAGTRARVCVCVCVCVFAYVCECTCVSFVSVCASTCFPLCVSEGVRVKSVKEFARTHTSACVRARERANVCVLA